MAIRIALFVIMIGFAGFMENLDIIDEVVAVAILPFLFVIFLVWEAKEAIRDGYNNKEARNKCFLFSFITGFMTGMYYLYKIHDFNVNILYGSIPSILLLSIISGLFYGFIGIITADRLYKRAGEKTRPSLDKSDG